MHMNRYKAFIAHLGISATIVGIFLLLTFFVWYPSPLFKVEGTLLPLQILIAVDIVLGPLLTLVVFKPGKKGLKFDLALIALVQLSAFIYGASIIYTERPAFVAFGVDRFTVVPRAEIKPVYLNKLDTSKIKLNVVGPTWVYAEKPTNPEVAAQVMFESLEGKPSFDKRPEFYRELGSHIENNYHKAIDLVKYGEKVKGSKALIDAFLAKHSKTPAQLVAYPLSGKHHDMVVVLDRVSKTILGTIDINPWIKT
ncbi:MAG: TfpX/TfpZ family type IV pilin accessory protein [Granulosicoccaceae bacterium]